MKRIISWLLAIVLIAGLLPVNALQVSAAEEESAVGALVQTAEDPGLPENEELFEGYAYGLFYGETATYRRMAGDQLTGDEKVLYDALVPMIKKIASGERSSTVIGVGRQVTVQGEVYTADVPATFTGSDITDQMLTNIIWALLSDYPYEMYWYDKVTGCMALPITTGGTISNVQVYLVVAANYGVSEDYFIANTTFTRQAAASAQTSQSIVAKYAEKTDYEKLVGYKDEICAFVSYDYSAASGNYFSYDNDPWQLIHVFDGDPSTNVVCEGYSKAFMYLCEQTDFRSDISCYLTVGIMGGPHMWNTVTIGDKHYLADVTNSESDCVGYDGSLFLAGGSGSISAGYTVGGYSYTYDPMEISTWGYGSDSILALAASNYDPSTVHTHSYSTVVSEPTCEAEGYTTYSCTCGHSYVADYRSALGHDLGAWTDEVAPNCELPGLQRRDCSRCDAYETRQVDELGHAFGDWYDEGQPTCQQSGTQRRDCIRCNVFQIRTVKPTGHTYTPYVVEPTYITEGYTEYICTCGDSYIDERSVVDSLPLPVPSVRVENGCLIWECEEGIDGFEIWRATSKSGKYTRVGFTDAYRWEDTDYSAGKTYYYKLRSVCGVSGRFISDYSKIVSVVYTCTAPQVYGMINEQTGQIVLTWEKVSGAKKYEIYRSTSEFGTYKRVTTTTKLTYTDTKAAVGTEYFYKVKAIASKSTYNSAFSWTVRCTAICGTPEVTIKTDAATGKPMLSWKAISGAEGYQILRRVAGEELFAQLDQIEGTTYLDAAAVVDTHYQYKVRAMGREAYLDGQPSNVTGIVCALARPTLKTKVNDDGKPVITWEAVEGAVGYQIYRSTSSKKSYVLLDTVQELSYTDESVAAGKTYYYKLVAVGQEGQSAQTDYVKLTGKCAVPELTVAAGATGKPSLSWNKIAGAKRYEILRSVDGATFKKLTTTTKTTYTDTKAPAGARCAYQVRALGSKSAYNGNLSNAEECYVICAAPTLTVKIDTATGKPTLSWKKVTGAAGYAIYRGEDGGVCSYLTTVTDLHFLDEATRADHRYTYFVKTVGREEAFDSVESAAKTVTVTVGQPKPVGAVNAAGKPVITWDAVEDAVAYKVYRSTKSTKSYKLLKTQEGLSYTDDSVATGKTYYYKIVAVGRNSESPMSAYAKITGACAQPEISSIGFNQDSGKPVITWDKVSSARKYEVWRSTSRDSGYRKLTTVTKTTYTDTTAVPGTFYYYQIRAVGSKSSYNSVFSNPRGCLCVCTKPTVSVKLNSALLPSLSWKKVDGAVSYEIYRATRGGSYTLLTTVSTLTYVDASAQTGDLYRYQVKAVAQSPLSNSGLSEQVLISIPCQATVVDTAVGENGKPMLTWDGVAGGQGYRIYRSTKKTSGFKLQTETAKLSYTDRNATKGRTYYYYVTVVAQDTESAKSNTVKIKCAK